MNFLMYSSSCWGHFQRMGCCLVYGCNYILEKIRIIFYKIPSTGIHYLLLWYENFWHYFNKFILHTHITMQNHCYFIDVCNFQNCLNVQVVDTWIILLTFTRFSWDLQWNDSLTLDHPFSLSYSQITLLFKSLKNLCIR